MKKPYIILEIAYTMLLSVFFYLYADKLLDYDNPEIYTALFSSTLILILATELVRRNKLKENRPQYEKYFFIPAMFLVLLFGMYYVSSIAKTY